LPSQVDYLAFTSPPQQKSGYRRPAWPRSMQCPHLIYCRRSASFPQREEYVISSPIPKSFSWFSHPSGKTTFHLRRQSSQPILHAAGSGMSRSIGIRTDHPSSSHHHSHRERSDHDRCHHHRSISSTTLLLVFSLIFTVLGTMLLLPSIHHSQKVSGPRPA
jgi:hypothetical protein